MKYMERDLYEIIHQMLNKIRPPKLEKQINLNFTLAHKINFWDYVVSTRHCKFIRPNAFRGQVKVASSKEQEHESFLPTNTATAQICLDSEALLQSYNIGSMCFFRLVFLLVDYRVCTVSVLFFLSSVRPTPPRNFRLSCRRVRLIVASLFRHRCSIFCVRFFVGVESECRLSVEYTF